MPDTICVQERLPPGAAAVLINRTHTYTDLIMPIDAQQKSVCSTRSTGRARFGEIAGDTAPARAFFERLWWSRPGRVRRVAGAQNTRLTRTLTMLSEVVNESVVVSSERPQMYSTSYRQLKFCR